MNSWISIIYLESVIPTETSPKLDALHTAVHSKMRTQWFLNPKKFLVLACFWAVLGIIGGVLPVLGATDADCAPYSARDTDEFW